MEGLLASQKVDGSLRKEYQTQGKLTKGLLAALKFTKKHERSPGSMEKRREFMESLPVAQKVIEISRRLQGHTES